MISLLESSQAWADILSWKLLHFVIISLVGKDAGHLQLFLGELPNLRKLDLDNNEVDDEGVAALVTGLANGSNLQILSINGNESITNNGWMAISKLLCDTSSVDKTFHSNHTLHDMAHRNYMHVSYEILRQVPGLVDNLELNRLRAKQEVAMIKILKHHNDFDLHPFFEWDLKMLPRVLRWLERANDIPTEFDKNIEQRKLSAIYRFARSKPELYIEGQLRDKAARELQVWYRARVSAKRQKFA